MNKNGARNKIAPSIFAADLYDLSRAVELFEKAEVDYIHFDVMDNNFVPNISFGAKLISDVISRTNIPSNVHLMINLDSCQNLKHFLNLKVQHITVHLEATRNYIQNFIQKIKKSGKTAGISIKPRTPVEVLEPHLDFIDLILLMSVEPGFSGQRFIPDSLERLKTLKKMIGGRNIDLQIDGGIGRDNYKEILSAGANFLVIGTAFYNDKDPCEWVRSIKEFSST